MVDVASFPSTAPIHPAVQSKEVDVKATQTTKEAGVLYDEGDE